MVWIELYRLGEHPVYSYILKSLDSQHKIGVLLANWQTVRVAFMQARCILRGEWAQTCPVFVLPIGCASKLLFY